MARDDYVGGALELRQYADYYALVHLRHAALGGVYIRNFVAVSRGGCTSYTWDALMARGVRELRKIVVELKVPYWRHMRKRDLVNAIIIAHRRNQTGFAA